MKSRMSTAPLPHSIPSTNPLEIQLARLEAPLDKVIDTEFQPKQNEYNIHPRYLASAGGFTRLPN